MKFAKPETSSERAAGISRLFSTVYRDREGFGFLRLCMVLVGFAPLFALMAIRGIEVVPDKWLWIACTSLVVVPMMILLLRLWMVWKYEPPRPITVGQVEESRAHILTYLFATFLPFYRQDLGNTRDLIAILVAVVFIILLFMHLNLHYMNIFLAVFGYHVYTIRPRDDEDNPYTSRIPLVVITRRRVLVPGESIRGYRLTNSLYWSLKT